MTYLDLINNVLRRLRENDITSSQIDSNPHLRMIGTCVNDAKDAVENAWNWSALRGDDSIVLTPSDPVVALTGSADSHYEIISVRNDTGGYWLYQIGERQMANKYLNTATDGSPISWATYFNDSVSAEQQIRLYPPPASADTLVITRSKHQDPLTAYDDVLLVPALPVYSLATALASRERGEVGGTPVSELFAIADSHLSDAIAIDTARYPEEQVWYVSSDMSKTNNRGY